MPVRDRRSGSAGAAGAAGEEEGKAGGSAGGGVEKGGREAAVVPMLEEPEAPGWIDVEAGGGGAIIGGVEIDAGAGVGAGATDALGDDDCDVGSGNGTRGTASDDCVWLDGSGSSGRLDGCCWAVAIGFPRFRVSVGSAAAMSNAGGNAGSVRGGVKVLDSVVSQPARRRGPVGAGSRLTHLPDTLSLLRPPRDIPISPFAQRSLRFPDLFAAWCRVRPENAPRPASPPIPREQPNSERV